MFLANPVKEFSYSGAPVRVPPFFDIYHARNGTYRYAENSWYSAWVKQSDDVSPWPRPTAGVEPGFTVKQRIPAKLLNGIVKRMQECSMFETVAFVVDRDWEWRGVFPQQYGTLTSVQYNMDGLLDPADVAVKIHSHPFSGGVENTMFSAVDDRDDQGFGLYLIAGSFDGGLPAVRARVGVYGCFHPVPVSRFVDLDEPLNFICALGGEDE